MSEAVENTNVPRGTLLAAGALLAFVLAVVGLARIEGVGIARMTPASPLEVRELRFEDLAGGAIKVVRAVDGVVVDTLQPGTNGFVRSVVRTLAQARRRKDIGDEPPFQLVRWGNGHFTLEDPSIGQRVDLAAFGSSNMQSFARLMPQQGDAP